jgi:Na+-transporting NADH:ubiquinone oxidoreductase subunit C
MSRDSKSKVLTVAFLVCVACSILVSVAAIGLKDRQEQNQEIEKRRNILQIARLYDPLQPVDVQFQKVKSHIVDLATGQFVDAGVRDVDEAGSRYVIPPEEDLAGIKVRPRTMEVYLVEEQGALQQVILPVYGKGLWSTMYGFIALGPDLTTVSGFGFYQHGETPGLGGEIENRSWLAKWPGKVVYDEQGAVKLRVIKGEVDPAAADARYKVDGLSGATLTARGVSNLLAYWLGENGYQPFLDQLRKRTGSADVMH